jgi:hypothetical protein
MDLVPRYFGSLQMEQRTQESRATLAPKRGFFDITVPALA